MGEQISTIFRNNYDISSNANKFYKKYWTQDGEISDITKNKNIVLFYEYFPNGLSNKKILEIGVGGEGGLIFPLMNYNDVKGIDISDSAISNCRNFGLDIKKVNIDKEKLPYENNSFDIVFAFEVFEHFSNPQFALEEIKRVLKSQGLLILSIPTPYTYHWPRLFYPSLFEFDNFREFMMVNDFEAEYKKINLFKNIHVLKNIEEKNKMYSWFWQCRKIDETDSVTYFKIGRYFWEQKGKNNLRIKPIEAIDMFRKSYKYDKNNITLKISLLKALLYRFVQGEQKEFNEVLISLYKDIEKPAFQKDPSYFYELLLFDLETKHLGVRTFNNELVDKLNNTICKLPGGSEYLNKLSEERKKLEI